MGIRIVEGKWEDVASKVRLAGRRVRIIYADSAPAEVTVVEIADPEKRAKPFDQAAWLGQLYSYSNSHEKPAQPIDLDRDRIFRELHGDPG